MRGQSVADSGNGMNAVLERSSRTRQGSVLVVDDDPWVHRLVGDRLSAAEYEVRAVATAAEGLDHAINGEFDIILLDLCLPDESGLEALRRLKAKAVEAGIVMISGDGDAHHV